MFLIIADFSVIQSFTFWKPSLDVVFLHQLEDDDVVGQTVEHHLHVVLDQLKLSMCQLDGNTPVTLQEMFIWDPGTVLFYSFQHYEKGRTAISWGSLVRLSKFQPWHSPLNKLHLIHWRVDQHSGLCFGLRPLGPHQTPSAATTFNPRLVLVWEMSMTCMFRTCWCEVGVTG